MATNTKKKKADPKPAAPEDATLKEQEAQGTTQEGQEDTQEGQENQGEAQVTQSQEIQEEAQEGQESAPEDATPYEATVAVPLAVIRRGKTPRPEDKPIGTLTRGNRVTVVDSQDGYAILSNGTYVKEAYLERKE